MLLLGLILLPCSFGCTTLLVDSLLYDLSPLHNTYISGGYHLTLCERVHGSTVSPRCAGHALAYQVTADGSCYALALYRHAIAATASGLALELRGGDPCGAVLRSLRVALECTRGAATTLVSVDESCGPCCYVAVVRSPAGCITAAGPFSEACPLDPATGLLCGGPARGECGERALCTCHPGFSGTACGVINLTVSPLFMAVLAPLFLLSAVAAAQLRAARTRPRLLLLAAGVLMAFCWAIMQQVWSSNVVVSPTLVAPHGGGGDPWLSTLDLVELRATPQPQSGSHPAPPPPPLRACVVLFGLAGPFYFNDSLQTRQTPWHVVFGAEDPAALAVDVFYAVQDAVADVGPRVSERLTRKGAAALGAGLLARGSRRVSVALNPQDSTAEAAYRVVRTETQFLVPAGDYVTHRFWSQHLGQAASLRLALGLLTRELATAAPPEYDVLVLGRLDRLQRGSVNVAACRAAFARGEFPAYRLDNNGRVLLPHTVEDRLIVLPAGPDLLPLLAALSRALAAPELLWEPGWSQLGRPKAAFAYCAEDSMQRAFLLALEALAKNAAAPHFSSLGASCASINEPNGHTINAAKYAPAAFSQAKAVYERVASCFRLRQEGRAVPLDETLPGNPWGECKEKKR